MLNKIINYSIHHKLIVILFTLGIVGFGIYAMLNLPIGAVPDITNNQVQVITTSRNLATQDVEKFLTYPVELEMANLPGVKEIRSVSKFGLSVVTVVFEDKVGTYLPRQLIAEKLKNAEEKIPKGFGTPFMGPVTTGLGEIYQYVIDVDSAHKDQYSITELRTIQDWIVKRQLSGIPGVVEVNTWGGYLKQYEVAIDPSKLRSMGIALTEVYDALEKNNSVSGGAYIERSNEAYFIRAEGLVTSLQDIENISITGSSGTIVYIRDIAKVQFGHANRFGAITANGDGEKVLGQVMMLKDADSKAVIERVKERVKEVQANLPEGVYINPILERSELIEKTTNTVAENLILGCLIVIFVVVLLLGNLRSGLVVASVIPICLLIAISLMYIFGVDANLMSLGAIDFGIIIDGAVIIVEYIAFKITSERNTLLLVNKNEKQAITDKITFSGASKMMHSAIFGQLIIIIVFIPILSLVNVEGKMFRPMALVFCFALVGAMILCFTYVPVMASLFIKPSDPHKRTISKRLIDSLNQLYRPTIIWALRHKKYVLSLAGAILLAVAYIFSTMGGEFVPTLDEGDFVIQPILRTGTSLEKTIETTTKIEQILKTFPEVDQVVSRIGAAEVPTDPMSMEESDVIIKLRPKSEWTTAQDKDALANAFKASLSVIPGVEYEFTQPIEMRFNELITGVRADVAIKIFGEDLDKLYKLGTEIKEAIKNVPGAADISLEKVTGLPQMTVSYNRQNIAKYGLSVDELNKLIYVGFAGGTTGIVFEGEKQFDLVLRYDEQHRQSLENIGSASVNLGNGQSLPLSEFAQIEYTTGPAKISRDQTKRRIVVGVNVRDRDLESVVKEVQSIIKEKIDLPTGYTIAYGGQFENLRTAKNRLFIAVPIALILIFFLLYFAFNSVKEALMIYSAIPLSAVGGVLLLWFRDLPFSISAGVGFIALFGIAVLNGIVLIEEFKELKAHGIHNINRRILMGTQNRLRPVLLTAAAAALGFLPMAVSVSAGAEIQRPLATVVLGGLISATVLTLVVLPVLYALFDRRAQKKIGQRGLAIGVLFFFSIAANAQMPNLSMEESIKIALEQNEKLKSEEYLYQRQLALIKSSFAPPRTELYHSYDQNNIALNGLALNVWGINQQFHFPTHYYAKHENLKLQAGLAKNEFQISKDKMAGEVAVAYQHAAYWQAMYSQLSDMDSIARIFNDKMKVGRLNGEYSELEAIAAESKYMDIHNRYLKSFTEYNKAMLNLKSKMAYDNAFALSFEKETLDTTVGSKLGEHIMAFQALKNDLATQSIKVEKTSYLPDLQFNVFNGNNAGPDNRAYFGYQLGLAIPLFYGSTKANVESAKLEALAYHSEYMYTARMVESKRRILIQEAQNSAEILNYYETEGNTKVLNIQQLAMESFIRGEIDYFQYVQLLEHAYDLNQKSLNALLNYNLSIINLNYLTEL